MLIMDKENKNKTIIIKMEESDEQIRVTKSS